MIIDEKTHLEHLNCIRDNEQVWFTSSLSTTHVYTRKWIFNVQERYS